MIAHLSISFDDPIQKSFKMLAFNSWIASGKFSRP